MSFNVKTKWAARLRVMSVYLKIGAANWVICLVCTLMIGQRTRGDYHLIENRKVSQEHRILCSRMDKGAL